LSYPWKTRFLGGECGPWTRFTTYAGPHVSGSLGFLGRGARDGAAAAALHPSRPQPQRRCRRVRTPPAPAGLVRRHERGTGQAGRAVLQARAWGPPSPRLKPGPCRRGSSSSTFCLYVHCVSGPVSFREVPWCLQPSARGLRPGQGAADPREAADLNCAFRPRRAPACGFVLGLASCVAPSTLRRPGNRARWARAGIRWTKGIRGPRRHYSRQDSTWGWSTVRAAGGRVPCAAGAACAAAVPGPATKPERGPGL